MGSNIIRLTRPTSIEFVTKNNKGKFPKYASKNSTEQGTVRCACNTCVGNLLYFKDTNTAVSWFEKKCSVCNEEINWSRASSYLQRLFLYYSENEILKNELSIYK